MRRPPWPDLKHPSLPRLEARRGVAAGTWANHSAEAVAPSSHHKAGRVRLTHWKVHSCEAPSCGGLCRPRRRPCSRQTTDWPARKDLHYAERLDDSLHPIPDAGGWTAKSRKRSFMINVARRPPTLQMAAFKHLAKGQDRSASAVHIPPRRRRRLLSDGAAWCGRRGKKAVSFACS